MGVVLVAEDDEDVRLALTIMLRRAGHTVLTAEDGVAALELARERRPEIVVTDIDMPRLNGIELARALRRDPVLGDVPVVVESGSLHPGDPRAADAEVCGVLLKPFANDDLVAMVGRLIGYGPHDHDLRPSVCPLVVPSDGTLTPA